MKPTKKVRAALAAAVVLGIGVTGAGVAAAAPTQTPAPPTQPGDSASVTQMEQMMQQAVQHLPADQRAAALRVHEQMQPAMTQMMTGGMNSMGGMGGMGGDGGGAGQPGGPGTTGG